MTCVLSPASVYQSPFSESGAIQKKGCDDFDFVWFPTHHPHYGIDDNKQSANHCRIGSSTGSSISNRTEIVIGLSRSVKQRQFGVQTFVDSETILNAGERVVVCEEEHVFANGKAAVSNSFEMCKRLHAATDHMITARLGVKRKAEEGVLDEVYIQSKRTSPFLNTPKERNNKRKKVLKISVKKLKQVDDPETFLRRTVLVNNTMKRLQMELRGEKRRNRNFESNNRTCFSRYGVLSNSCMSNCYLLDGPFPNRAHEKITDDMTDTLMSYVNDKVNDMTSYSDIGEKSDLVSSDTEILDTHTYVDSSMLAWPSCDSYTTKEVSRNVCICTTCEDNRKDVQKMSVDTCNDLMEASRCNINNRVDNFNIACTAYCKAF